jgi:hypothetical protein
MDLVTLHKILLRKIRYLSQSIKKKQEIVQVTKRCSIINHLVLNLNLGPGKDLFKETNAKKIANLAIQQKTFCLFSR